MNKFLIIQQLLMYTRSQLNHSRDHRAFQYTRPFQQQQSQLREAISPIKQKSLRQTSLLRQTALKYPQNSMLLEAHQMLDQTFAEEIFMRSINRSYIGQMSGKKQQLHQIKFEEMEERANLSLNESNIIAYSRIEQQQQAQPLSQVKQTLIAYQDARLMKIVSFSNKSQQLFKKQQCMPCSTYYIVLVNQSSIQIYTRSIQDKLDTLLLSYNFDTIAAQVEFEDIPQNNQIVITAGTYRLSLQHESRDIVEWWHQKLSRMISSSKGSQLGLTGLLSVEQFYKQRLATEQYFASHCETGDIILFQDDHFFAKAQRFFTQSDFDHVGMVIKDLNYGTLIFEANSGSGVCLTPWRYVVKYQWYKSIPKIAWRRLKGIDKDNTFNSIIQKFILQNIEKHYHISFAKITANQSIIRPPIKNIVPSKDKAQGDDTGFFCSQLIATVYKQLGLLTRDVSSPNYQPACKFYPKDFSERSGRKLDFGELSPEYTIHFDDKLLKVAYNK